MTKGKVVYIEDNPLNRKVVDSLLTANNYEVVELTQDFTSAVRFVAHHKPDAILLDIQLAGVSGIQIAKEIKAEDTLKSIPLIAVTALAMKHDRDDIMAAGCDDYISKPFKIEALLALLAKWI